VSVIFDVKRWWPAPLLPREDGRQAALLFVIAVLSYLACLAAIGGLAADRAASGWREQLAGSATVVVKAGPLEDADAAAARAAETLAGVKGVIEARALEKAKADALLAPWIGPEVLPEDLPVPRLVAIQLDPSRPATAEDLKRAVKTAGINAEIDDHSLWTREIMRAGALARWAAGALFATIVISEQVGVHKPDPRVFQRALDQLACAGAEAWFVGDHPRNDVLGAAGVGMQPIWLTGVHPWPDGIDRPGHRIDRIEDVLRAVMGDID